MDNDMEREALKERASGGCAGNSCVRGKRKWIGREISREPQ